MPTANARGVAICNARAEPRRSLIVERVISACWLASA
jgi:hypothetical protein